VRNFDESSERAEGPATAAPAPDRRGRIAIILAAIGLVLAMVSGAYVLVIDRAILSRFSFGEAISVIVAVGLLVIGVLLLIGGLGYYVLAPGFRGRTAAWTGFGSHRLVLACTALIVLVANIGPLLVAAIFQARGLCSIPSFTAAALSIDLALIGLTYLRFIRPGVLTMDQLGLKRGRLGYNAGAGLLIGVGVLIVSAIIQGVLQGLGVRQTQLVDLQCVRDFPLSGFLAVVLAGGLIAPMAEELYFRGYVFRSYLLTRGRLVAYLATSILFAVLHLNLPALLPILVLSLVFCWAYERTGSIVPSMVGHALNNTVAFCILYFTNSPV